MCGCFPFQTKGNLEISGGERVLEGSKGINSICCHNKTTSGSGWASEGLSFTFELLPSQQVGGGLEQSEQAGGRWQSCLCRKNEGQGTPIEGLSQNQGFGF